MTDAEAVKKHGGIRAAARSLGVPYTTFSKRLKREVGGKTAGAAVKVAAKVASAPVKGIADFRNLYDKDTIVPLKIRAAIKRLTPSGWEYEMVFAKDAGVGSADMATYRDQFADYVVVTRDRKVWAGSVKLANELRRMI
jgi:hypothetical protein